MKSLFAVLVLGLVCSFGFSADGVRLPAPQKTGGLPVLEAIDIRGSAPGTGFPKGAIRDDELSTILWAASGHNRDGRLWTVPMAMGREPYCKIYVLKKEGAYLYDWRGHSLVLVASDELSSKIAIQPFAQLAPVNLLVVADGKELGEISGPFASEFALVLAGAMSQHVYLSAEAHDIGARLIYSIKRDEASRLLNLSAEDTPLFAITLGKR